MEPVMAAKVPPPTLEMVYNLVRAVTYEASRRQEVAVERISFADALG
jgi:hypothetical protein